MAVGPPRISTHTPRNTSLIYEPQIDQTSQCWISKSDVSSLEFGEGIKQSLKMIEPDYAPGIPFRVTDYANTYKKRFQDNATTMQPATGPVPEIRAQVFPQGINKETFDEAIQELKTLVDGDVVLVNEELDDGWYLHRPLTHDAFPLGAQDEFVNSAICSPGSVEQVQAVVRWANKWLIPIYPISMGRNLGLGNYSTLNGSCLTVPRIWRCSCTSPRIRDCRSRKEDEESP